MNVRMARFRKSLLASTLAFAGGVVLASPPVPANAQLYDGQIVQDSSISDAIEDEYLFDPTIPYDRIDVTTKQGVVTLDGRASNLLVKRRAERIAETVKGVRAVINDIEVLPMQDRSGTDIEAAVKAALVRNQATESYEIAVTATDVGMVTLDGIVESWAEAELAETVAAGINGVVAIENRIDVAYDTKRGDVELKKEIEERLKWNILVDSGLIDVSVTDGKVRLAGTVGSVAERRTAKSEAWVNGVTSVDASGLQVRRWARDPDLRMTPAVLSDEAISKAVEDALLYDPRVNLADVDVDVETAGVTLRGVVDSISARRAAESAANNTTGVLTVENRIKVRLDDPVSDSVLQDRVEAALVDDPLIDASETMVSVDDGIVRLYGTVDSYFHKTRTDNVVAGIDGVTEIRNALIVEDPHRPYVYDPYVDPWPELAYGWYDYQPYTSFRRDQEIEQEIRDELWWSPFVDADQVKVAVVDGVATLTGTVDSRAERRAATENAFEGGAVWVVNELDVDLEGA